MKTWKCSPAYSTTPYSDSTSVYEFTGHHAFMRGADPIDSRYMKALLLSIGGFDLGSGTPDDPIIILMVPRPLELRLRVAVVRCTKYGVPEFDQCLDDKTVAKIEADIASGDLPAEEMRVGKTRREVADALDWTAEQSTRGLNVFISYITEPCVFVKDEQLSPCRVGGHLKCNVRPMLTNMARDLCRWRSRSGAASSRCRAEGGRCACAS
jgi:hypothetical protein